MTGLHALTAWAGTQRLLFWRGNSPVHEVTVASTRNTVGKIGKRLSMSRSLAGSLQAARPGLSLKPVLSFLHLAESRYYSQLES